MPRQRAATTKRKQTTDVMRTHLSIEELEDWLWSAACSIRGAVDAPKYKDYILPLIFIKRLSDVLDDEIAHLASGFGSEAATREIETNERWSEIVEPGRDYASALL
jgi:type I restriction enzyme M protein